MKKTLVSKIVDLIALIRPKQWVKNAFVLGPLLLVGAFLDVVALERAFLAMLLFCVASSATYILNDMRDIEHDRLHAKKSKTRPLASGAVSIPEARTLLILFYGILCVSWFFMPSVMRVITLYMAINLAYSFGLKHQAVIDIFIVAFGFVLRVYAGAEALAVPISHWMLITTLCLALYLASIKRRQELLSSGEKSRQVLENYSLSLVDHYAEMSATGALIFYSMFVMSAKPALVITIPFVLFGLFRYWYVAEKLEGGESPTDVLFADKQLLLTIVLWVGICAWVLWP